MNKTNNKLTPNVITVDIDKLSSMLACGHATARKIGEQAEARIYIGRNGTVESHRKLRFFFYA